VLVLLNFTPVPRHHWRVGVPQTSAGSRYREVLNSDSQHYGGSNLGNLASVEVQAVPCSGLPCSLVLNLPPLGAVILSP
jgi:1,4-alpha-glucan branching enzyme